MVKKEHIEKFAVLIALESEEKGFTGIGNLESRAGLLSLPLVERLLKTNNIKNELEGLCVLGRNPEITQEGRNELYNPENRAIVLEILGKTMDDLGDQFKGYGTFMTNLSKGNSGKTIQDKTITLQEFKEILREIYDDISSKEYGYRGLIPIDLIKDAILQKIQISNESIDEMILELEKSREIDLQVAYDSATVKRPEMGIKVPGRGLIYLMKFR